MADAAVGAAPVQATVRRGERRMRRRVWPRDFGAQFDPARVDLEALIVKFADGAGVRARGLRFEQPSGARDVSDAERLALLGMSEASVSRAAERLTSLVTQFGVREIVPLVKVEDEERAARQRQLNEESANAEFEDLASFVMLVLPRRDEALARSALDALRSLPFVEFAYVQPHAEAPRSTPACADQLPGVTPTLPLSNPTEGPAYQRVLNWT